MTLADTTEKTPDATVYYDGSCALCSAEIGLYERKAKGGAVRFVDISQEGADPGPDLDRVAAMGRFHVRRADGTLVSGARGFAALWQAMPGWQRAGRIASLPGIAHVLEIGYRAFLPIRPLLSRIARAAGAKARNPKV